MTPDFAPLVIALLAALCAMGVVVAVFYSRVAARSESRRRFEAVAGREPAVERRGAAEDSARKRSIDKTLRELEEKQKARPGARPSLTGRMRQAGLNWGKGIYYLVCLGAAGFSLLVALGLLGINLLPALGFGLAGGLLLPHLYINLRRRRRFRAFTSEFPNAVDVIVRGVKSGLPLVDCMRIIASEAQEPVRSEFRLVIEDQTLGLPLDEAVQRLPERVPLAEANFFAIVITLQTRTGGSLSETLGNLSRVLRERKKMEGKIKAMSSEAKASAGIIGALPVVVASLLYLAAPQYISLLFTTLAGKFVLAACAVWMLIGILMMRKMINFDF